MLMVVRVELKMLKLPQISVLFVGLVYTNSATCQTMQQAQMASLHDRMNQMISALYSAPLRQPTPTTPSNDFPSTPSYEQQPSYQYPQSNQPVVYVSSNSQTPTSVSVSPASPGSPPSVTITRSQTPCYQESGAQTDYSYPVAPSPPPKSAWQQYYEQYPSLKCSCVPSYETIQPQYASQPPTPIQYVLQTPQLTSQPQQYAPQSQQYAAPPQQYAPQSQQYAAKPQQCAQQSEQYAAPPQQYAQQPQQYSIPQQYTPPPQQIPSPAPPAPYSPAPCQQLPQYQPHFEPSYNYPDNSYNYYSELSYPTPANTCPEYPAYQQLYRTTRSYPSHFSSPNRFYISQMYPELKPPLI